MKPIEKDDFSDFFLLFPPAAAAPAPATLLKPMEKNDCSYFFLLFPAAAAAPDPATPVAGCGAYSPTIPSSKSPWQWRTEKHQNCAQKLPNVTSETHRTCYFSETHRKNNCSYLFLLFPAAAAPAPATPVAGCDAKNRTTPSSKSPWQWRTEKHQNCAQKLPNVTSETHRKRDVLLAAFSSCFLLFPPAAATTPAPATPVAGCDAKNRTTPSSKSPWHWRTEKYKIAPKNCLM